MMDAIAFTVPVVPVPKARARVRKDGLVFTPRSTVAAENDIGKYYRAAYPGRKPWPRSVALELRMTAVLPTPASGPGRKRVHPTVRPDLDNYLKCVMDALNGLVWEDDAQVVTVTARKMYGGASWYIEIREA